jgi:hypothetical protein
VPGRVYGSPASVGVSNLPTPGVFGQATVIHGSGIESDPYVVIYAADILNYNANTIVLGITFPNNAGGVCRLKYLSVYSVAAAAGQVFSPYVQVLSTSTGASAAFPLGSSQTTTQATDFMVWNEVKDMELATQSDVTGSVSTQTPFRLYVSSYAATDDADVMLIFEWWS